MWPPQEGRTVTDDAMLALSEATQLTSLSLFLDKDFTDAMLQGGLAGLDNLQSCSVLVGLRQGQSLSLSSLSQLHGLTSLQLSYTCLRNTGFVREMTRLQDLCLSSAFASDCDCNALTSLTSLTNLCLLQCSNAGESQSDRRRINDFDRVMTCM